MSCVTKVELDMPVVTAHSSYMYWGTLQRHEARQEGRELRGEREREEAAGGGQWSCVKRGRGRTAVHSGSGNKAKWRCFKVSFNSKMAS